VDFVGPVADDDKIALLTLCHALTFPSHLRSEAFGISLLEAAMFGKAMISTEIGTGTSYVNVDGETGLVVPASDPGALRKAMGTLWNDGRLASELGANARLRFETKFTAERMVSAYVNLYERLIGERPA
jgi:glycosyltransferase involved in cell wall biosynthesis